MSDNLFDDLRDASFDVVSNTMGYEASWEPSEGGNVQTARVLFNNPTEGKKLSGVEYDPYHYEMEYRVGHFEGLKQSVDSNNIEAVTIRGKEYNVRQITAKWDGNTMIAVLEPKVID